MISAVLSIAMGVLPYLVPMPVVMPVLGLVLGANGLLRERRRDAPARRRSVVITAAVGMVVCALAVVTALLGSTRIV